MSKTPFTVKSEAGCKLLIRGRVIANLSKEEAIQTALALLEPFGHTWSITQQASIEAIRKDHTKLP